jgi:hypothetical protein
VAVSRLSPSAVGAIAIPITFALVTYKRRPSLSVEEVKIWATSMMYCQVSRAGVIAHIIDSAPDALCVQPLLSLCSQRVAA